jgi:ElaA protein
MEWYIKTFDELTAAQIYEILRSRAEIFLKEQGIHYVDPDGTDYDALHVFGMENGRVRAYLRAYRTDEDSVKIGRVLTLSHGNGIGTELMKYALSGIPARMNCKKIVMDAQKHAVSFYERLGFKVTSGEYLEEGIVHVDMEIDIG